MSLKIQNQNYIQLKNFDTVTCQSKELKEKKFTDLYQTAKNVNIFLKEHDKYEKSKIIATYVHTSPSHVSPKKYYYYQGSTQSILQTEDDYLNASKDNGYRFPLNNEDVFFELWPDTYKNDPTSKQVAQQLYRNLKNFCKENNVYVVNQNNIAPQEMATLILEMKQAISTFSSQIYPAITENLTDGAISPIAIFAMQIFLLPSFTEQAQQNLLTTKLGLYGWNVNTALECMQAIIKENSWDKNTCFNDTCKSHDHELTNHSVSFDQAIAVNNQKITLAPSLKEIYNKLEKTQYLEEEESYALTSKVKQWSLTATENKTSVELSNETMIALMNILNFKMSWSKKMNCHYNSEQFTNGNKELVLAKFQNKKINNCETDDLTYFEDDKMEIVFQKYVVNNYTQAFILPKKEDLSLEEFKQFDQEISDNVLYHALKKSETNSHSFDVLDFFMPNIKAHVNQNILDILKISHSDFNSDNLILQPNAKENCIRLDAYHETVVENNYKGTTAIAVAVVSMGDGGFSSTEEKKIVTVRLNRPFAFAIMNTNTVLFKGRITGLNDQVFK